LVRFNFEASEYEFKKSSQEEKILAGKKTPHSKSS